MQFEKYLSIILETHNAYIDSQDNLSEILLATGQMIFWFVFMDWASFHIGGSEEN